MGNKGKFFALILVLMMATSCVGLLTVEPANAQSIPAPATPTFTVKFVNNSYTTPITTTSSTDPYTNKTTTTETGGQYIEDVTIEIIINNQELPPTLNSSKYSIYYSIRLKPHFEEKWIHGQYGQLGPCNNSLSPDPSEASITEYFINRIPKQSDGQYTIFSIDGSSYKPEDQIDFQVKAVIGHTLNLWIENYVIDHYYAGIPRYGDKTEIVYRPATTQDTEGNWSTIQTLTIPSESIPSVDQPPLVAIGIAGAAIAAVAVSLVFFLRKRHR